METKKQGVIATAYHNSECWRLIKDDSDPKIYFWGNRKTERAFGHLYNRWQWLDGDKKSMSEKAIQNLVGSMNIQRVNNSEVNEYCNWLVTNKWHGYEYVTKKDEKESEKMSSEVVNKLEELTRIVAESNKRNTFEEVILQGIIEKGREISVEGLKEQAIREVQDFIAKTYGAIPKTIEVRTPTATKNIKGLFHEKFEEILMQVGADIPVMLVGGAGTGKNYTLEQVAESLGLDFYMSNAVTQEYKLTGFIDANGRYHETEFYKAFVNGGLFMLDEIDASVPDALILLNSAIANKYFDFPIGRVKAHPDFRVVSAGNTTGNGADMQYVGRNQLDGASIDRFTLIQFDYSEQVERNLANDDDLYAFIVEMRRAINDTKMRHIVSMRATINSAKLVQVGMDKEKVVRTAIVKSMNRDDLNTIVSKMNVRNEWFRALDRIRKEMM